jgi:DNA polymerase III subunit epsilon
MLSNWPPNCKRCCIIELITKSLVTVFGDLTMGVTFLLIVILAGIVGGVVLIARRSEQSQEESGPQPTLGLRVHPAEELQRQFHVDSVRESGRACEQHAESDESTPKHPSDDVCGPFVKDRQLQKDRLRAVRETHRPRITGELSVPLLTGLSAWLPERFVVLDLETTGLSPEMDEIIEIGAIRATLGMETHATFETLVIPQKEITEAISRINGITQRMVERDGRPTDLSLREFVEFIGDLPLVTFNAPFDMGFLWSAGRKCGIEIKNRYACALQISRRAWPNLQNHRLPDLARWAKLPSDDMHRALGDSERALRVFVAAVSLVSQKVRWEYPPLDWHVTVQYNEKRDANRAFCAETRPFETIDVALALSRYAEAMEKMYEYEAEVDGRFADASILDRFSLCLWKLERYSELVDAVDQFVQRFPDAQSSVMTAVFKRRERAKIKLTASGRPASRESKPATNTGVPDLAPEVMEATNLNQPPPPTP